jgi:hypothetical protein
MNNLAPLLAREVARRVQEIEGLAAMPPACM